MLLLLLVFSSGLFAQSISLDQAIQSSARTIESRLPQGARVAVLVFSSSAQVFSDYIIDELATAISTSNKIQVIDRQHTDAIRSELNIQMSGDVSYSEVRRVGQQLGAQYIVTGSLVDIGNAYRFRVAAIDVESAVREGASSLNININDPQVVFLLTGQRTGVQVITDLPSGSRQLSRQEAQQQQKTTFNPEAIAEIELRILSGETPHMIHQDILRSLRVEQSRQRTRNALGVSSIIIASGMIIGGLTWVFTVPDADLEWGPWTLYGGGLAVGLIGIPISFGTASDGRRRIRFLNSQISFIEDTFLK